MAEKKIWILAGEASGDLYGARLARELRAIAAERGDTVRISGMGGPQMVAADIDLKVDSTELGVVGVIEVVKHLLLFIRIFFLTFCDITYRCHRICSIKLICHIFCVTDMI